MASDSWRREKGQVPDGRRPQGEAGGPLRLRDWLVAQIESGRYAGLRWEDASKTLFRIPWKHASKQDYRAQQDAALFRVRGCNEGPPTYTGPPLRDSPGVSARTPLPMDLPFPTSLGSCPAGVGGEFRHHHSGKSLNYPLRAPAVRAWHVGDLQGVSPLTQPSLTASRLAPSQHQHLTSGISPLSHSTVWPPFHHTDTFTSYSCFPGFLFFPREAPQKGLLVSNSSFIGPKFLIPTQCWPLSLLLR